MDDLLKKLIAALEPGTEVTITIKKPPSDASVTNTIKCPHCGWKKAYSRHDAAVRGWENHKLKCKAKNRVTFDTPQWLIDQTEGKEL